LAGALRDQLFRSMIGRPGRLLINRCGTFPLDLYRHGKLVVRGSCYVHALQYQNYPWLEYRINRTRLSLPAGRWVVRSALRDPNGGTGGRATQSVSRLEVAGTIIVHERLGGMGGAGLADHAGNRLMGSRITCGLLAGHLRSAGPDFVPVEKVFATIGWPSFKLLGTNVPVDPTSPDGGLTA
jgi:hypothetical protein